MLVNIKTNKQKNKSERDAGRSKQYKINYIKRTLKKQTNKQTYRTKPEQYHVFLEASTERGQEADPPN